MIESSLSAMAKKDEDTFLMMVIYTLTISYEQITKKYNAVDLTTQEVKDLKVTLNTLCSLYN